MHLPSELFISGGQVCAQGTLKQGSVGDTATGHWRSSRERNCFYLGQREGLLGRTPLGGVCGTEECLSQQGQGPGLAEDAIVVKGKGWEGALQTWRSFKVVGTEA